MAWKKPLGSKKARNKQVRSRRMNKSVSHAQLQCTEEQTTG